MATFGSIADGALARRSVQMIVGGGEVTLDVRVINPMEEAGVLANALAFAKARGVQSPVEGDPLYDYGVWLYTCLVGCVDSTSSKEQPAPFFEGGEQQILNSRVLTKAHLAFLAEHQRIWQDENAPYRINVTDDKLLERIQRIAEGDIDPFAELEPATRWLFVRTLASLFIGSLGGKSASGGLSPESASALEKKPDEPTPQPDDPVR